jgi:small multidrug resistance pump
MSGIGWLALAIGTEIVATVSLKYSEGFSRPLPVVVMVIGYAIAFYGLSETVKSLPLGLVYAIWSGIGTLGAVLAGRVLFAESLGWPQVAGIVAVIGGVALMNTGRAAA